MNLVIVAIVGLALGSFISMLSYRLMNSNEVFATRSHCTLCNHTLSVQDLIPIFSWLHNHGKCRYCHQHISIRYLIIELATAFICLVVYKFFWINNPANGLIYLGISLCLITIIVTDFEHYMIPDIIQIVFLCLVTLFVFVNKLNYTNMFLGATLGVVSSIILRYLVSWWKDQDSLGIGDIKFIAIAGLFLGAKLLPFFFFLAGVIGMLTSLLWRSLHKESNVFPFGPALAISFFFCMLYPNFNEIFNYHMNNFMMKLL